MSEHSRIEWTDATWNPIRGCTKISPGCAHCYAETFAERFRGVPSHPYEQGFDLKLIPGKLADPLRWPKPRMVFVNSMSDLFHRDVPYEYDSPGRSGDGCRQLAYVSGSHEAALERMRDLLQSALRFAADASHVWWGVSVEDRAHGLPRVEHLRAAPAGLRMLSVEPLLEDLGEIDLSGIGWVILGGESGHGARPMRAEWVVSIRDQCRAAGVPFFFKQWGGVHKGKTGRMLEDRFHDESPARSCLPMPGRNERRALAAKLGYTL